MPELKLIKNNELIKLSMRNCKNFRRQPKKQAVAFAKSMPLN
jgi:hypothetical protein